MKRRLTGKWALKKKWFGFIVMVEVIKTTVSEYDLSPDIEVTVWEKAKDFDLIEMKLQII